MRYLSVCSGIEAASAAWHDLGWAPLAFSEIEPFPRAVLAHHFPSVPLHSDFTVLRDQSWIADADLLVGGTPCQAFSVAGLRGSLADARGNLTLEFVRLANAIDDLRRAAGRAPSWIVWENVPGVLSVSDNAFGAFLGGLVGSDAAIEPPTGRGWTDAGVVHGPRRCAAWRVLDAQHFGVAQRRRRVFVLARGGAGDWAPADALLPVGESVRWHSAPRREAGQRAAPSPAARTRGGGGLGTDAERDGALIPQTANAITASMGVGALGHNKDQNVIAFCAYNQSLTGAVSKTVASRDDQDTASLVARDWPAEIAPTLNAAFGEKQGLEDQHALGGAGLFVAHTLQTQCGFATEDGTGRSSPLMPVAVATHMQVRRLTPRECERLQGFPDDWTAIPWRGKPAAECPDGPRYKALGNSMAVPVMRWIGERIAEVSS